MNAQLPNKTLMDARAKAMRSRPSDAEGRLWKHFRNRNFLNLKFRRQVQIGPYIVDFLCVEKMLIIEADGGQHNLKHSQAYDEIRSRYLEKLGYTVLRFWNTDILGNTTGVLDSIIRFLDQPLK